MGRVAEELAVPLIVGFIVAGIIAYHYISQNCGS